jgi:Protein of unknown function (DUF2892)
MKKNMGTFDQIFRIIVAIAICVLYYNNVITGTLAIVLGVLAVVFFLTSMLGSCPLYTIIGINTCKIKKV